MCFFLLCSKVNYPLIVSLYEVLFYVKGNGYVCTQNGLPLNVHNVWCIATCGNKKGNREKHLIYERSSRMHLPFFFKWNISSVTFESFLHPACDLTENNPVIHKGQSSLCLYDNIKGSPYYIKFIFELYYAISGQNVV